VSEKKTVLIPSDPLYRVSQQGLRKITGGLYVGLQKEHACPEVGKHVQQDVKVASTGNERNYRFTVLPFSGNESI
jgi:hypothetical protein